MRIILNALSSILCTMVFFLFGMAPVQADGFYGLFGGRTIDGSGDLESEVREFEEFDAIESHGSFDIFVTVGPDQKVTLTYDDNLLEYIDTEVRRGVLEIGSKYSFRAHRKSRIDITVRSLEDVSISGSGDIEITDLKGDFFELNITGSGDVELINVDTKEIDIGITGSGDVQAEGKGSKLKIKVSGSGDVDARKLEVQEANVRISGSGDVGVFATESFTGRVSGSGDIDYYGNPEDVSSRSSGSGDIKKRR